MIRANTFLIVLCLFCFSGLTTFAQNTNYLGLFPTIDHSADLSKRFGYNVYIFDAIKPYSNSIDSVVDDARSLYFYTEAGLSYKISPRLSFTASYVYERQNPFRDNYRNEHRTFQQLTLKLPLRSASLKQRLRFDERFIENRISGNTSFSSRLRYLIGFTIPLKRDKTYFMAYTEAFMNTTPGAKYLYDENWSAAQIGFRLSERSNLETGLLYVGWIQNSQKEWLNQYYLQVTWVSHFDFTKSRAIEEKKG